MNALKTIILAAVFIFLSVFCVINIFNHRRENRETREANQAERRRKRTLTVNPKSLENTGETKEEIEE